jgi:glutathione S-transferase
MTRLITIPFSHYCEKARWALERCGVAFTEDGHLPVLHYTATFRARGGRTVPVLVDDKTVLRDSTEILAWADARRPGALYPDDATRADVLALEDDFDRQLGPATRRWAYFQLLPMRGADAFVVRDVPTWQQVTYPLTRPIVTRLVARSLNVTADGVARSVVKIDAAFARVGERLRDGRRYLAGDRFTAADLTFAALAAPVLWPEHHPVEAPPRELWPRDARDQVEAWRATAAGAFALRLYAEHRS